MDNTEKLVVIGSRAMLRHASQLAATRKPRDIDYIAPWSAVDNVVKNLGYPIEYLHGGKKIVTKADHGAIYEFEIAWPDSLAAELYQYVLDDPESICDGGLLVYASLDVQYTLKMSHRFLRNSPHFLKTMSDTKILRDLGAKIPENLVDWYKARTAETYDYAHPSLSQSKKDFFAGDGVPYVYDHDSIHQVVKVRHQPAYEYFKVPGEDVKCSRELFDACIYDIRLSAVYEESCVLALERSQIPFPHVHADDSFAMALMKVCTSITSGWFREFAWENYDAVMGMYAHMPNYSEMFKDAVAAGEVKMHSPG